jgi:hypothetical protein
MVITGQDPAILIQELVKAVVQTTAAVEAAAPVQKVLVRIQTVLTEQAAEELPVQLLDLV